MNRLLNDEIEDAGPDARTEIFAESVLLVVILAFIVGLWFGVLIGERNAENINKARTQIGTVR